MNPLETQPIAGTVLGDMGWLTRVGILRLDLSGSQFDDPI
jgi:hypothetical protein